MNPTADMLVSASKIITLDPLHPEAEALIVGKGRIIALGTRRELAERFRIAEQVHFDDAVVYPGFMDPHCHFLGFGYVLQRASLFGLKSWEETVGRLVAFSKDLREPWLQGRGWDQNLWEQRAFPDRRLLDRFFPHTPVIATRVDGHAAVINGAALSRAGIDASTRVEGGVIVSDNGVPTGLLIDKAIDLVKKVIPVPSGEMTRHALLSAQAECRRVGLCSVSNAGTEARELDIMRAMKGEGALPIGIYAMLLPTAENIERHVRSGPFSEERLTVRSIKMFADGALGSRGAFLLEPYADDPGNRGLSTLSRDELERVAALAFAHGYQMNVHAIGDAAARLVLDVYEKFLPPGNDLRWRIEHAQLIHPDDLPRFGRRNIIPSIQTTHATSDMGWTEERLGAARMSYSHPYRALLAQNGWLANGSDFPIEAIDPLRGFRSAVFRKNDERLPPGGFMPENALDREEALKAMTIWAARANFEEKDRGSLEPGKWADFTVLSANLLEDPEEKIWEARVLATGIAGDLVLNE